MNNAIVWFRQDLRLNDHRALNRAVEEGYRIVACYVLDDKSPGEWALGGASRWWLHHALADLDKNLQKHGGQLILRRGDFVEELEGLVHEVEAKALFFSRNYEPYMHDVEQRLHDRLEDDGIEVKRFAGNILFDPATLRNKTNQPYKVFTPFWKSCLQQPPPPPPLKAPRQVDFVGGDVASLALPDLKLLPENPDWSGGLQDNWSVTEDAAHASLQEFLDDAVAAYRKERDIPGNKGTSRLSPYLHFGQISAAQVWHATQQHLTVHGKDTRGAETFLSELGWREFSYHLLQHFPKLQEQPFRANFANFPWRKNSRNLRAWQRGQTGFPVVDAGMRELWHTGWMHNRVRMIVASLLVKELLIPWQQGEAWFWDTLVDADLASNSASWQWVAGCGADAAPYFRIFNPILQGEKFDAQGDYVRRWVPELKKMPKKWIHRPADAPADVLADADVKLGKSYPRPIIDRKVARQRALDAFQKTRNSS
ncbi:MAG: deoxyribodipyrimidine photo-lyase [Gammaproteobacteria bacterium]|nr:deoxyribodipyrimidine photo-lyase [Gammaproteobacteria bacterium]